MVTYSRLGVDQERLTSRRLYHTLEYLITLKILSNTEMLGMATTSIAPKSTRVSTSKWSAYKACFLVALFFHLTSDQAANATETTSTGSINDSSCPAQSIHIQVQIDNIILISSLSV